MDTEVRNLGYTKLSPEEIESLVDTDLNYAIMRAGGYAPPVVGFTGDYIWWKPGDCEATKNPDFISQTWVLLDFMSERSFRSRVEQYPDKSGECSFRVSRKNNCFVLWDASGSQERALAEAALLALQND